MPEKGIRKKGRKGSQRPSTASAAKSPVFLGTLLTPDAEAGESYGTPADDQDWYNQSSESDTVDPYVPAVRPSLILASLHGATGGEEPADRFWGGPVYGPGSDGAESCGEQPDQEDRYSEMDSAGSYDPYLTIIWEIQSMERQRSAATSACSRKGVPIVRRKLLWR
ncbi:hypothetical protein P4O66_002852 [Electrophorus voltai]|uniref:Uncharacterized protein n=1 Tax=Electrophorus voltai TaxID=2609070 RepID=A0AAD8YUV9_9TELE|nr:hypothetical protein P4O66_002852 [Electrophorus voltai]